jgi:aryl carrier-like protein
VEKPVNKPNTEIVDNSNDLRIPIQEGLSNLWENLLGQEHVDSEDDFFELGGHSLLAMRAAAKIRQQFNVAFTVDELFDNPTLSGVSQIIVTRMTENRSTRKGPIRPRPLDQRQQLSFAQERLWLLHQFYPEHSFYNVQLGIRLQGKLQVPALEASLKALVERHEIFRTTYSVISGELLQMVHETLPPVIEHLNFGLSDPRFQSTIQHVPMDLEKGPQLKALIARENEQVHQLILTMDHIVADEWSTELIMEELGQFYAAYVEDKPPALEPLTVQYGDYALWQREWLDEKEVNKEWGYWQEQLDGMQDLRLPLDYSRPELPTFAAGNCDFQLNAIVRERLHQICKSESVTLSMALLTGFALALNRWTQQDDIVIGMPITSRDHPEVERVIGFFTNTQVLRFDFSKNPTWRKMLGRTRQATLRAYEHRELPFDKLVEHLAPERQGNMNPLVQVLATVQIEDPKIQRHWKDLICEWIDIVPEFVRFDFEIYFIDNGKELYGNLVYQTELFDKSTMERFSRDLVTGIEIALENPDQPL